MGKAINLFNQSHRVYIIPYHANALGNWLDTHVHTNTHTYAQTHTHTHPCKHTDKEKTRCLAKSQSGLCNKLGIFPKQII